MCGIGNSGEEGGGGGGGVEEPKFYKAMHEAKLKFADGWGGGGVIGQIPSMGGMDIFWNHTMLHVYLLTTQDVH